MSRTSSLESYDQVPYFNTSFAQTHPDRLATVATLLGLDPPPIDRCRVLELGCALGGNLIPMALALPGSRFLGIDQSPRQIAEGRRVIAGVGLANIELRTANILDLDDSYGSFDYIISHGVYSWVPAPVREKLLDVYRRNLAPEGIGYISFNALPGWHLHGMIRHMMLYHIGRFAGAGPRDQIGHARELLDFLAKAVPGDNNPYGLLLRQELERVKKKNDANFLHDQLEVDNDAFYFHEFCDHLKAHELRYLGEANIGDMGAFDFPPEVRQVLAKLAPGQIEMEQYLDFLRNRAFRQTLVCHEQRQPSYAPHPDQITRFFVASAFRPAGVRPDLAENAAAEFVGPKGEKVSTMKAIIKAAMCCLAEAWPQALAFDELCRQARALLNAPASYDTQAEHQDALTLAGGLLSAYRGNSGGMIELRVRPLPLVNAVSARPTASPLVRWQAAHERQDYVINLRHQRVDVPDHVRKLLALLDGTRDRVALVAELVGQFRAGQIQIASEGQTVTGEAEARAAIEKQLEPQLVGIARAGLLAG